MVAREVGKLHEAWTAYSSTSAAEYTLHSLNVIPDLKTCRNVFHLRIGEISKFRLYEGNLSCVYIIHVHVGGCP